KVAFQRVKGHLLQCNMPSFGKQKVTRLTAYGMIRDCGRAKGKERPQGFVIKEQALTLLKWRQGLFHQASI
ncbi:MAG: hypothetical protein KIC78_07415, partial [Prevotella sp.]|uniref:hypothetical protein n=1 Tax=Prevotella sp. TaxID=59823 RepID=UPI00257AF457